MLGELLASVDAVPDINDVTQIDVRVLALLAGVVVPLLTAVVTKRLAHPGLKAFSTLVLSVIGGWLAVAVQADGVVNMETWIDGLLTSFTAATVSYYGLWKPTTIAPRLQQATAAFGIGSNNPSSPVSAWEGDVNNTPSTQVSPTPDPTEPQKQPEVTDPSEVTGDTLDGEGSHFRSNDLP